jgi:hypothetical protein
MDLDILATWGDNFDSLTRVEPFGRKWVIMIKITDTIKIPLAAPKTRPKVLSTHPRNTRFKIFRIRMEIRVTTIRIMQNKRKNAARFLIPGF